MVFLGTGFPLIFLAFLASSPSIRVYAALTNMTIDDTNSTFWTWAGSWNAVTPTTPCSTGCTAQPDPGLVYNSTWHDGGLRSGSFVFQGSAVHIYGIDLYNPANISFAMNNPSITSTHYYEGEGYVYNSLFSSVTNLDPTVQHTVTWILEASSEGGCTALFDYAMVTLDQTVGSSPGASSSSFVSSVNAASSSGIVTAATTHKSESSSIVGVVVGVVGGLAILGALIVFLRRRKPSAMVAVEPYYVSTTRVCGRGAHSHVRTLTRERGLTKYTVPTVSARDGQHQSANAGRSPDLEPPAYS
ncbi:hypothetical protein B0H19DRAFT_1071757 [Mycena capillaripes]|nr:hypothetical protein B0H19DRAFT_1071757 [Mycena capillaripes]